jgi:hypothetical protein
MTGRPTIDVRADIEPGDTLTKPKTDQDNRQTGRTTQQIKNAVFGAVFVWVNSDIKYPTALAAKLGRHDLEVRPLSWLKPQNVRGRRFSGVVVDHAAPFCSEAYAALSLLQFTAGVDVFIAKRRFLDQVAEAFHQQLHTRVPSEQLDAMAREFHPALPIERH